MKFRLPIILSFVITFFIASASLTYAQISTPSATPQSSVPIRSTAEGDSPITIDEGELPADGEWIPNANVTFVGKTANRSGDFLDWTLRNYDWACVKDAKGNCTNRGNPLQGYWYTILIIVYALLIAVVLVAAFVMIITRGRNLTITRFIPRFIFIVVLISLSYPIIQFIYQITDIIQGFFLRVEGQLISTKDLIFIGFDYVNFEGARRFGAQYDESAFITLLLVRLTAITYYVMTGVLLIRKIILWFFLVLSPVFPLLLFFRPIRNTGKIWIGEFFRWLLYAPLFAIFLHGLVVLWKSKTGIPLAFDFTAAKAGEVVYPTAVNILIGGPGQRIFFDPGNGQSNSVNLQDTFALYVVALLMLWVVIILPFLLLKIFLDYLGNISWQDNAAFRRLSDRGSSLFPKPPPSPSVFPPPLAPAGAGLARTIPTGAARSISAERSNLASHSVQNITSIPVNAQILQLANLSVPKMRDIAKFETATFSKNASRVQEANRIKTSLHRISNPTSVASPLERERYSQVKQQLVQEKQKGNVLASSILSAANTSTAKTPGKAFTPASNLPAVNKVQQVSIEDYEEVRKMWLDTYQNSTPPTDLNGKQNNREEWVKSDIDKINQAIALLNSVDPMRAKEGMDMVSNILPFLMIGGFSKTEVIAYLKAKLEAAKDVLNSDSKRKEDEDTMVDRGERHTTAEKHLATAAEIEEPKREEALPSESAGKEKLDALRRSGGSS
jgi:hypothetical protein